MSEFLPLPNIDRLRESTPSISEIQVVKRREKLLRIQKVAGAHPADWNEWRSFGPLNFRFDHHLPPPHNQDRAIAYFALGKEAFTTALGEVFQDESGAGVYPVDVFTGEPTVSIVALTRELRVLDLGGSWITRAGGNQAINTGSRAVSRQWSAAIYELYGDMVSGVSYPSSVYGPGRCVALFQSAATAIGSAPLANRLLNDPSMEGPLATAIEHLGTHIKLLDI